MRIAILRDAKNASPRAALSAGKETSMALFRAVARSVAAIAVLGALTLSGTAAQASPESSSRLTQQASPVQVTSAGEIASARVCGFYEDAFNAFYNHCGGGHVLINISTTRTDYYWCIGPGLWRIGRASDVYNAWYIGATC